MRDNYLINYNLFCKRRKFSLEKFLRNNPNIDFDKICEMFRKQNIEPPAKSIFDQAHKKILLETLKEKESLDLANKNKEVEKKAKEVEVPKKTQQKPRRRRRKSKND